MKRCRSVITQGHLHLRCQLEPRHKGRHEHRSEVTHGSRVSWSTDGKYQATTEPREKETA